MKCQKQPEYLLHRPTQISDVWEIRLTLNLWQHLVQIARSRKSSYSSITRYCVFRLLEDIHDHLGPRLEEFAEHCRLRKNREIALHRHMACFYGEDVKLVRLAAMRLGITVTLLVRIALCAYIGQLDVENHSYRPLTRNQFIRLSTKQWLIIAHSELNMDKIPILHQFTFSMFLPWQWWS